MDEVTPAVTDIADVELERFDLSVRTRNCLWRAKVKRVGELTALSAADILRWQNAGKKTLHEIRELLGTIGLQLKGDSDTTAPINMTLLHELATPAPPSVKPRLIRLREAGRDVQRRLLTPITSFSLSTRAKNVIVRGKLQFMAELVQLKFGTLLAFDSSGKKTATELDTLVKTQGFVLGTEIPDWSRETARELEKSFADERQQEIIDRSSAVLAKLGPEPGCLEDELRRIAAALESGRNLELLIELWGWNGSEPRTLESVGFELTPSLTRERVRQIESKALRRLRPFKFDTPHLRASIALLRKAVPSLRADLSSALRSANISAAIFQ
jgi:hypothetical protein